MSKDNDLNDLAERAGALGNTHRLTLLEILKKGPLSVDELASRANLSLPNTSRHLQVLRRASLVEAQREGKYVFYRLGEISEYKALIAALRAVRERNAAAVRDLRLDYLRAREQLEPISREELLSRLKDDAVTLIDVRPESEFSSGHIPGALNVPLGLLEACIGQFPSTQEIVAYCRGPHCILSFEAVAALQALGYKVRRLEDGLPQWSAAGLSVVTTP
ncbi:metalloregulator ArsR/SmtB family transcription factor [Alcaligenes sp. 13f]|uniref:ArsR/SmtB family transcription factor n=1 Tax=Alcaligenes sp. 13f TaxID=2841924 RepID=UPI001CF67DBB|nr:metalloregulator ArsR/SmtB family transcription factor [Alcaligenes sp. 13f]MCB4321516.1 metalloregulator ArsR/SmtB family transcription factor [Alcaligenes sp. 13f]